MKEQVGLIASEVSLDTDTFNLNDKPFTEAEKLADYHMQMTEEHFQERYGLGKGGSFKRLSRSAIRSIWRQFIEVERRDFFDVHRHMNVYDVARVGIDKFVYVMGWEKKHDAARWRNNKIRIGICCHCRDQFVMMILQQNHGLCKTCRPLYSSIAIRNFLVKQLWESERYQHAHRDLFMDFFILFYNDVNLRALFWKGSDSAKELEADERPLPDWYDEESGKGMTFKDIGKVDGR
jgi:hypothetical protein